MASPKPWKAEGSCLQMRFAQIHGLEENKSSPLFSTHCDICEGVRLEPEGTTCQLDNLIWLEMSLLIPGVWIRWLLKVPSDPDCSMIFWSVLALWSSCSWVLFGVCVVGQFGTAFVSLCHCCAGNKVLPTPCLALGCGEDLQEFGCFI